MTSRLWYLLALPLVLPILKTRPGPSRERVVKPNEERVILLGSSSGVGRDLAHAYAKRGAYICLVARRADSLETVKAECLALGAQEDNIMVVPADISRTDDLLKVRDQVVKAWSGFDTLHILAGVPSTSTLHDLAGVTLTTPSTSSTVHRDFELGGKTFEAAISSGDTAGIPTRQGLEAVAAEARICGEINYVGVVIALACFLPLLASTSKSPALHHLSSVAATIPAPRRTIYSATKAAGLMAVEACRVECEGSGVRFFSLCPGTIANDFRLKTPFSQTGGKDELNEDIKHSFEGLLLQPKAVIDAILYHLSLNPKPQPLIPYLPFSLIPGLKIPPKHLVHLPWQYRIAAMIRDTPLGWSLLEPSARKKYGIPG